MTAQLCPDHGALLHERCLLCQRALQIKSKALRLRNLLEHMPERIQAKSELKSARRKAKHK